MTSSLVCAVIIIINMTTDPINRTDLEVVGNAIDVCKAKYKDSSCVKKVFKRPNNHYHVLCGVPTEPKKDIDG